MGCTHPSFDAKVASCESTSAFTIESLPNEALLNGSPLPQKRIPASANELEMTLAQVHMIQLLISRKEISGLKHHMGLHFESLKVWCRPSHDERLCLSGIINPSEGHTTSTEIFICIGSKFEHESLLDQADEVKRKQFVTKKGVAVGYAANFVVDEYEELRNVGLLDWIKKSMKYFTIRIFGHGSGGAIASLLMVELYVDHVFPIESEQLTSTKSEKMANKADFIYSFDEETKNASLSDDIECFSEKHNSTTTTPTATNTGDGVVDKESALLATKKPNIYLSTLGAPRLFDESTGATLSKIKYLHQNIRRYINQGDIIPTMPKAKDNNWWRHLGEAVCYRHDLDGWFRLTNADDVDGSVNCSVDNFVSIENHSLSEYEANLMEGKQASV